MSADAPDATWRRWLAEGKFMIQRSASAGVAVFPPRVMMPGDGVQDLEWVEASGRGAVHSFTLVTQKPPAVDYNICLVDLEEGPRLMTRLVGVDGGEITIGASVEAVIDRRDEAEPVLLFRPVAGS